MNNTENYPKYEKRFRTKQFEYMINEVQDIDYFMLGELGRDGWEMCAATDGYFYFKREIL